MLKVTSTNCPCGYLYVEVCTDGETRVTEGDEKFEEIVLPTTNPWKNESFLVCPKCGSLFLSSIAYHVHEE